MEILRLVFDLISSVFSLFLGTAFLFLYIRLGDNLFKIIKSIFMLYDKNETLYIAKKTDDKCIVHTYSKGGIILYQDCSSDEFGFDSADEIMRKAFDRSITRAMGNIEKL